MNTQPTLAETMFETAFEEVSDKSLLQMQKEIQKMKAQSPVTFRSLIKVPFVKQMFEMIELEYGYRNQMEKENIF